MNAMNVWTFAICAALVVGFIVGFCFIIKNELDHRKNCHMCQWADEECRKGRRP